MHIFLLHAVHICIPCFVNTALPLKAKDVGKLFGIKWGHCRVWRIVGTEMGIDVNTLDAIEKNHTNDADRLHTLIDSANPSPTHETMAKILQSSQISNAIAGMIHLILS